MASKPIRRLFIGAKVFIDEREHTIVDILGADEVRVLDRETGQTRVVNTVEIQRVARVRPDITTIPDADWLKAEKRYESIRPLLEPGRTSEMVRAVAEKEGKSIVTIYRWIARAESTGAISSLVHSKRSDKGTRRLPPEVEAVIDQVVQSDYLTTQRKSVTTIIVKVRGLCLRQGYQPPSGGTIRNRIEELSARLKLSKRHGPKKAREKYDPVRARTEQPAGPLVNIEMDNWNPDVILVDDIHRRPLGRPWVTLAIDDFSKMVLGFNISFDKPSALGTGLALIHAARRKTEWLVKHDINAEWPCFGLPKRILSDNGREFQNKMLRRACEDYKIGQDFRPKGKANYGGIVERLFRTLNAKVHEFPGTTFKDSKTRGDYKSTKKAVLTLFEFERVIGKHILKVYHEVSEDELGMSPRAKWDLGILGGEGRFATGLPDEITDVEQFRLDFLPYVERTIQRTGAQIDNIDYWEDTLSEWIDAPDPANKKLKRKFTFRVDPRNIASIWFLDPKTGKYLEIGYRDKSRLSMSKWELKEIMGRFAREGKKRVTEQMIFEAYEEIDQIVDNAVAATKQARLAEKRHEKYLETTPAKKQPVPRNQIADEYDAIDFTNLKPYGD